MEIRLRAQRLVERLRGRFLTEDIDPQLVHLVTDYGDNSADLREQRIAAITELLPQQGATLLARIARFEDNERLSKTAALAIMLEWIPKDAKVRDQWIDEIEAAVGPSSRTAASWLSAYAESFRRPSEVAEQWAQFVADEQDLLVTRRDKTRLEFVRDLQRIHADLLLEAGRAEQAGAIKRALGKTAATDTTTAVQWLDWLLGRSDWSAVTQFAEDHAALFRQQPTLLYGLAEAQRHTAKETVARQTAEAARQLSQGDAAQRFLLAVRLEDDRGLFKWAEKEYRQAIDEPGDATFEQIRASLSLSEMLHDQQLEQEAAEVLSNLLKRVADSAQTGRVLEQMRSQEPVRSRMHYFYACHYAAAKDRENQIKHMELGFAADPTDADLLIAMYRLPDPPPEWRARVVQAISDATELFRQELSGYQSQLSSQGNPLVRAGLEDRIASNLNQIAWLVGNTEGNYEEAVRSSQRSLAIKPGEAGYLDTLGRCYFTVGDFKNALKYQRQAAQRAPHELQIRRQLQLFEDAAAEAAGDLSR